MKVIVTVCICSSAPFVASFTLGSETFFQINFLSSDSHVIDLYGHKGLYTYLYKYSVEDVKKKTRNSILFRQGIVNILQIAFHQIC